MKNIEEDYKKEVKQYREMINEFHNNLFYQYALCGFKKGKWYREHPNFQTVDIAEKYLKKNRHQFKDYEKVKIQRRQISLWEDLIEEAD